MVLDRSLLKNGFTLNTHYLLESRFDREFMVFSLLLLLLLFVGLF